MRETIWKYALMLADDFLTVDLSIGARILTAATQGDGLYLWARVTPGASTVPRRVYVVGTGHPMPSEPVDYISTVQLYGGRLVFHVFATPEPVRGGDDA